jgi:ketosteroid isomerase-like protein
MTSAAQTIMSPTPDCTVDLVRSIYDAYESGDGASYNGHIDPDIEFFISESLPWGGSYHGFAGLRAAFDKALFVGRPHFEPEEIFDAGDSAVAIGRQFSLLHESAREISMRQVHVWRFIEGRVLSLHQYAAESDVRAAFANGSESPCARPNLEIVRSLYDAYEDGDFHAPISVVRPDIELRASSCVPWGGVYRGAREARTCVQKQQASFSGTIMVDELLDAGEHIVAIGRLEGYRRSDGHPVSVRIAHVWRFVEGKVASIAFNVNQPEARRDFGEL